MLDGRQSPRYIPSLDGLRALAILMVIYSHLSVTHVLPHAIRASVLGSSAVILFFVLSGFLITLQLRAELDRTRSISLPRFYIRRSFRLVPAMLLMLVGAGLMAHWKLIPVSTADYVHALTYTADYYHPHYWTMAHLWSLSVEEQFYLLWPVVLLLSGVRPGRFPVIAILICPVLRLIGWYAGVDEAMIFRRFEFVADSLAFGCLLALYERRVRNSNIWRRFSPTAVALIGWSVFFAWSLAHRFWPASEIIGRTCVSVSAVLIIAAPCFFPQSRIASFLSWPPLVWIGKISYSLYLWQQIFLVATPGVSETPLPPFVGLFAAVALAGLSYYLVELPLRRLGRRVTARPGKEQMASSSVPVVSLDAQKIEA